MLALVAALAGCGSPPPPEPPHTLKVVMGSDITTLDPITSFDDVSSIVLVNVYQTLVEFDRNLRIAPGLAQRWINPDDRTWRFHLDPGARFPDGSPVTAGDVKFSIEQARSLPGSQLTGFVRHVSEVVVVDPATVDVRTDSPVAILNSLVFIPILSEKHAATPEGARLAEQPFGSGPYRLVSWERGKGMVLEANPHRPVQPEITRVEIRLMPGLTPAQVLQARSHVALYLRRSALKEMLEKKGDLDVHLSDNLAVYYITFNVRPQIPGRPGPNPLAEARVRRALALAVDRDDLAATTIAGFRPASQLVVPQVFGYDPEAPKPVLDTAAARKLLEEAGAAGLTIELDTTPGSQWIEKALVRQWEAIGAKVTIREHESEALAKAVGVGEFTIVVEGYGCTTGDASELLTYGLHSHDEARALGPGNHAGYANAEVDRIVDQSPFELDARKRQAMLQAALRQVTADAPYVPLGILQDIYVTSHDVAWTPAANGEFRVADIRLRPPSQ